MRRTGWALAAAAVVGAGAVAAMAEAVRSGLQAGEGTPAFNVVDVSGPAKGKQLCYV